MKNIIFVPTIGTVVEDVMTEIDWYGDKFSKDSEKCLTLLSDGVNRFSEIGTYYERPEDKLPESKSIAVESACNEAKKIGLQNMAEVITTENIQDKKLITKTLVEIYTPEPKGPAPGLNLELKNQLKR